MDSKGFMEKNKISLKIKKELKKTLNLIKSNQIKFRLSKAP